jgi:ABC-type sugar transport system permease subunit
MREEKVKKTTHSRFRKTVPFLLLSPVLILIGFITIYPTLYSFWLSLTRMEPVTGDFYFVGIKNFLSLLPSREFLVSLRITLTYTAMYVIITMILGYVLALMFNRKIRLTGIYMTLIFIPWILSEVIAGLTWRWIFNPQLGIVEIILQRIQLSPMGGMVNHPIGALLIMVAVSVWRFVAYIMILLLAGLQSIPKEIFESGRVDGVTRWKAFWKITFPLMKPTTLVAVILITIGAVNYVGLFLTITNGGPMRSTEVFSLFLYHEAFEYFNLGYAAAISIMMLIVNLILAFFYIRSLRSEIYY